MVTELVPSVTHWDCLVLCNCYMFVAVFAHVVAICIFIVQPGIGKYLLTLILLSKSVCYLANYFFRHVHFLRMRSVGEPILCCNDVADSQLKQRLIAAVSSNDVSAVKECIQPGVDPNTICDVPQKTCSLPRAIWLISGSPTAELIALCSSHRVPEKSFLSLASVRGFSELHGVLPRQKWSECGTDIDTVSLLQWVLGSRVT